MSQALGDSDMGVTTICGFLLQPSCYNDATEKYRLTRDSDPFIYRCNKHKIRGANVHRTIPINNIKDTRPIQYIKHSIDSGVRGLRVLRPSEPTLDPIDWDMSIEPACCIIYSKEAVHRSDGVLVTVHECETHWVVVTWVPEASL